MTSAADPARLLPGLLGSPAPEAGPQERAAPPAPSLPSARPDADLRRPLLVGALAFVLLVGGLGGWAALTPIAGAVVTQGEAVVRGEPQLVQSLEGGVILEIAVRNGDRVEAGQALVRLDPTMASADLGVAEARLADALALEARLEAERDGRPMGAPGRASLRELPFPAPDTARQEAAQARILEARAAVLASGRARLAEAQAQAEAQLAGIAAQGDARRSQLALLREDLDRLRALEAEGLARGTELNAAARALADTEAQIAGLEAEAARVRTARRDAELANLQEQRTFRESVESDLRVAVAEADGLVIEVARLRAMLDRAVLRSPAAGIVHELAVATPGGVVAPGETLLQVVPLERGLDFDLRLDPRAVDEVRPGQAAEVVISSLDPRATPRLRATVVSVAPGTVTDRATGRTYFPVTLSLSPSELARLGPDVTLVPGTPIQAFIQTGDRSVLSYLVEPMAAQMRLAFREG